VATVMMEPVAVVEVNLLYQALKMKKTIANITKIERMIVVLMALVVMEKGHQATVTITKITIKNIIEIKNNFNSTTILLLFCFIFNHQL
jgi:LPS O-antigen subunit length determinant protein (WzzB/FepE family)